MNSFFYNNGAQNSLTEAIVSMIDASESYIKTGNFLFQDPMINHAIIDALERGVAVFILSNISDPDDPRKQEQEDGGHVDTHQTNLKILRRYGAHCRGLDDLHAKFIICDGKQGLLMSANYSPNSIARNIETGIRLGDNEICDLEYTFDILYMNSDVQGLSGGSGRTQISRTRSLVDKNAFSACGRDSDIRLTIASSNKKHGKGTNLRECRVYSIYDSILDVISNARERLDIVTWHFKALDKLPEFTNAIRAAIDRGVRVRLYSNCKQPHPGLSMSMSCIGELERMGCSNFGDDCNHSKCVISESEGIIFTANIDGNHGLRNGFEVGCMLNNEAVEEMRTFVESLFAY